MKLRSTILIMVALAVVISLTFGCIEHKAPTPMDGNLTVYYIDVGQGDAELICYKDHRMLIDLGPEEAEYDLYDDLVKYNATTLDVLVITHPHADHYGNLEELEEMGVYSRTIYYDGLKWPHVDPLTYEFGRAKVLRRGDTIRLGDLNFTVLWPDNLNYVNVNDDSVVLRTSYGNVSFVFEADATSLAEQGMIGYGPGSLDCDVLKVAHHGSKYSSSNSFLALVEPEVSIIEVGHNDYGHPDPGTVNRLDQYGAVYTTQECGTIAVTTDGVTYTVTTEK